MTRITLGRPALVRQVLEVGARERRNASETLALVVRVGLSEVEKRGGLTYALDSLPTVRASGTVINFPGRLR